MHLSSGYAVRCIVFVSGWTATPPRLSDQHRLVEIQMGRLQTVDGHRLSLVASLNFESFVTPLEDAERAFVRPL